ncbi:hypothetical protein HPB51_002976 [Rhipicephalus microplus]|uniref:Uncharacterized protein n=1 Tax=Rhipicephalus microplus TaxID=6941 RepID=A0A9J6EKJ6_RHIMP|nr:hypothetical protein HPB51_002976 [Rhipicephalus microplus]
MRKAEDKSNEVSSAKKVRVQEQMDNMQKGASTYSFIDEDIESDEEADSFTQVTYKKGRFKQIPVVFRPVEEMRTSWKVNPHVNKAASLQYQHDIIYGRTQQDDAPEPNMNTINPARPPRPQASKRQDPVMTYAQAARGKRKQEKREGTSTSQQQARKESQEGPQEKSNPMVNTRESTSTSHPKYCAESSSRRDSGSCFALLPKAGILNTFWGIDVLRGEEFR